MSDEQKSVEELLLHVVKVAESVEKPPATWPNLTAVSSSDQVWAEASGNTVRAFVYVEGINVDNHLGSQLVLEAIQYPNIVVRRMSVKDAPSEAKIGLYEVHRNGSLHLILSGNHQRSVIDSFNGVASEQVFHTTTTTTTSNTTSTRSPSTRILTTPVPTVIPDGLYLSDLESNIYHSFWAELAGVSVLQGKTLAVLKDYVHILALYHPGGTRMRSFLTRVDDMLQRDTQTAIMSQKWLDSINRIQREQRYPPLTLNWTGCKGSEAKFRGFPCSLWMTFHALTVHAYVQSLKSEPVLTVVSVIRDYIINFLQCDQCAKNFERDTANQIQYFNSTKQFGVLYLWAVHNEENRRLEGAITEDPRHPKVQFPIAKACPACRSGLSDGKMQWENDEVLPYLIDFYKPVADVGIPDGDTPVSTTKYESSTGGASPMSIIKSESSTGGASPMSTTKSESSTESQDAGTSILPWVILIVFLIVAGIIALMLLFNKRKLTEVEYYPGFEQRTVEISKEYAAPEELQSEQFADYGKQTTTAFVIDNQAGPIMETRVDPVNENPEAPVIDIFQAPSVNENQTSSVIQYRASSSVNETQTSSVIEYQASSVNKNQATSEIENQEIPVNENQAASVNKTQATSEIENQAIPVNENQAASVKIKPILKSRIKKFP